ALHNLLGPQHRRGLDPVGREPPGRRVRRAVVDHDGQIGQPGLLDAGGDARRAEPGSRCDGHGATPIADRPAVSGRPSMRLAFWMACPAAPLPRLSMAATTVTRPVLVSATACRWTPFDPATAAVVGQRPSGSRQMNGSPV